MTFNVKLEKYQEKAAKEISRSIRDSFWFKINEKENNLMMLKAITGAGKTVILSNVIYQVSQENKDDYCVLWVSYSPNINEQSKDKLISLCPDLDNRTTVMDYSNYLDSLKSGFIYFLNYSKLSENSNMNKGGADFNNKSFWDLDFASKRILLIVDEVHIGESGRNEKDSATILADIIKTVKPKYILGASATPENFINFVHSIKNAPSYTEGRHEIDIKKVANSKMIKSELVNYSIQADWSVESKFPQELFNHSIDKYKEVADYWKSVGFKQYPIFLFQLDKKYEGKELEEKKIIQDAVDAVLSKNIPYVSFDNIYHTIPKSSLEVVVNGNLVEIQRIEPNDIAKNPNVRFVIFKDNLSVGWDCPRAELLFSLKKQDKDSAIIQTIGRILRNPFIDNKDLYTKHEFLTRWYLYTPKFNQELIRELTSEFDIDVKPEGLEANTTVFLKKEVISFFEENKITHKNKILEELSLKEIVGKLSDEYLENILIDVLQKISPNIKSETIADDLRSSLRATIKESSFNINSGKHHNIRNGCRYVAEKKEFKIIESEVDDAFDEIRDVLEILLNKWKSLTENTLMSFYEANLKVKGLFDIIVDISKENDFHINVKMCGGYLLLNYLINEHDFILVLTKELKNKMPKNHAQEIKFMPLEEESFNSNFWNVVKSNHDGNGLIVEENENRDNFLLQIDNLAYTDFKKSMQAMRLNNLEKVFVIDYILKQQYDFFWRNPASGKGLGIQYLSSGKNEKLFRPDFLALKDGDLYILEGKSKRDDWIEKFEGMINWIKSQTDFKGRIYHVWFFEDIDSKSYYLIENASAKLIDKARNASFLDLAFETRNSLDGQVKKLGK